MNPPAQPLPQRSSEHALTNPPAQPLPQRSSEHALMNPPAQPLPQRSSEHALMNPPMGHSPQSRPAMVSPYSQYPYGIPGSQYAGVNPRRQFNPSGSQPQFNPYGTLPGPHVQFVATSASNYHPTNVVPGSHHGQPQLPGASPWNITSAGPTSEPPPHGDRPSTVDGVGSSATNSQSPHQQTSHHQGPDLKFSIDMSCDQLCVWLEQKRVTGTDLQVFKDQNVDGDTFSTLPNDSDSLEKKLKCTLTLEGSNRLRRLIQQLHKAGPTSGPPPHGDRPSTALPTSGPPPHGDRPSTVDGDGSSATNSQLPLQQTSHHQATLHIKEATTELSGDYRCEVSNEISPKEKSSSVHLDVTAKADQVRCLKICGCMCIAVLVATLAVIVGVCYGLPGGDVNTVVCSSQLKMKLTGTIIHPDGYPTLPTLLNFTLKTGETINVINMIAGNNFKQFGAHVLNDDQRVAVNIIVVRHRHDPVPIVTEILTNWLAGMGERPPTWSTLVKCLRTMTLHGLADRLEGQYDMTSHMGG